MKKLIMAGLIFIGVVVANGVNAEAKSNLDVKVFIDGAEKTFDQQPVLKDGRVFIPIRGVSESTGAEVIWNQEEKSVTIMKDGQHIFFREGSTDATVNGQTYVMPSSFKVNDRILVPIRFITETMNFQVEWDKNRWAVVVNTPLEQRINKMIAFGEKFTGTPYLYGGVYDIHQKFDCSSFVQYIFQHINVSLPRTSYSQSLIGTTVENTDVKKGDLLFFDINKDGVIDHVSIYINENKLFHSTTSLGVNYTGFTSYWKDRWVKSNRIISK